jgi:hypothetical protein
MPAMKRKASHLDEPAAKVPTDTQQVLGELEAALKEAAGLYLLYQQSPRAHLRETGVTVVRSPVEETPEDEKALLLALTERLEKARPLPVPVREALLVGDSSPYSIHWKKQGSAFGLLLSHAMPQPINLDKAARLAHKDSHGNIFQWNPVAAEASLDPYMHVPWMRDFLDSVEQDEQKQQGQEVVLYVGDDGAKVGDGKNPTDVHCDPPQKPSKNLGQRLVRKRIQVAFCAKTTTRLLKATPLTAKGFAVLECFLAGRGGFTSLEKYPDLCALLKRFAVGPEPGERAALCWDSHAPHFEEGPRGPSTIRLYAGFQFLEPSQVSSEEMIRLAFLRLHGYAFAPFERKANGANELFVNAKSTQSHVKGLPPDPTLAELFRISLEDQKAFLQSVPDFKLKLLAVKRSYLEEL